MNSKYDVVIIGAGIGGLICGCYLVKAGLKVLIVEQHSKPGGYCTSFRRDGYYFDVGVRYLGSLREGGPLRRILKDLSLWDDITFIRNDPCDRIIVPDKSIFIRANYKETIEELIINFPKEKNNIINFFDFIFNNNFLTFLSKVRNLTFEELLNNFFKDHKLISILSIPLGNLGLPPSQISALVSIILYKEYILDGGYYPRGGIQILPDLIASRFKLYGGEILYNVSAQKIFVKNKTINGIGINNEFIKTKIVVSNCDARTTFKDLVECDCREKTVVDKLMPSTSAITLYLGLDNKLENITPAHYTTWFFSTYDVEECYGGQNDVLFWVSNIRYLICDFPSLVDVTLAPKNKSILKILLGIKEFDLNLWEIHKQKLIEKIFMKINKLIPNIQNFIEIMEIATPFTFNKFTSNLDGALFGWASTKNQVERNILPQITSIKGLYLVGHWTTCGVGQGGITQVALSGEYGAKIINREIQKVS